MISKITIEITPNGWDTEIFTSEGQTFVQKIKKTRSGAKSEGMIFEDILELEEYSDVVEAMDNLTVYEIMNAMNQYSDD